MELATTLSRAGVSDKAAKVYLSALQLGPSSMTQLSKAAGLKRPTTYLLVDELLMQGFLSTIKKGKRVVYSAEHPKRIHQSLQNREREFQKALPELEALYYEPKDSPRITSFEGIDALLGVYDEIYSYMGKEGEVLFFTDLSNLMTHIPESFTGFVRSLSKLHPSYRLRELDLDGPRMDEYVAKANTFRGKNHHIRVLDPEKFPFANTDTMIYQNKVVLFSFKKVVTTVVIEHQQIADTQRALFNAAWEVGSEVS